MLQMMLFCFPRSCRNMKILLLLRGRFLYLQITDRKKLANHVFFVNKMAQIFLRPIPFFKRLDRLHAILYYHTYYIW